MNENSFPAYVIELDQIFSNIFRSLKERHVHDASEMKLSMPQFVCLCVISKFEKIKMSDLASYLALSYASATNLINRLVTSELVDRYDSPEDRRIVIVSLTEKGKEISTNIRKKHLYQITENCKSLSEEEIDTMVKGCQLLSKILIHDHKEEK